MATRTVTALFDRYQDAAEAVRQLETAGIAHADIAIVSNDSVHAPFHGAVPGEEGQGADHHLSSTGTGASLGTLLGGGAGLLAGLGVLAIPGLGPVVAAGWLASTLLGAGVGAAAGGLVGSLTDEGFTEDDAAAYVEGLHRGGTLVTARVSGLLIETVTQILDRDGARDVTLRAPELLDDIAQPEAGAAPEILPVGDPALAAAGLVPAPDASDVDRTRDPTRVGSPMAGGDGANVSSAPIGTGRGRLSGP